MMKLLYLLAITSLSAADLATAQPATRPAASATETLMEVSTKAREARMKGDVPNWLAYATQALVLTPDHPDILISVARANAAAGNKGAAIEHLARAARKGAAADPVLFAEFKPLAGDPLFEAAAAQAKRNLVPVAKAASFATTPESEGIGYDPVSRRLFIGTADEDGVGELFAVSRDGKISSFAKGGGLRQILGIKVDADRRLLWAVSGRYPDPNSPSDAGTGGVRAYNLDTGALVRQAELDERPALVHGFNDMALAANGTVYVTDSNTMSVYMLAPGSEKLELLLRDTGITFPNGIALANDQRTLYVAHVEGISAIDLPAKARRLLPVPADGTVNSIDGLLLKDGIFYGVQNSPYLQRIVGAALSPDGRSIARIWTVTSRAGYNQTTAAIADGALYVVGGAPLPDIYGGGAPSQPAPQIWKVSLER